MRQPCLGVITKDFFSFFGWGCVCSGGMTWTGMDSLINNHHVFLPDLNWSHMLSLEPRHRQPNVHQQVLIGPRLRLWISTKPHCGRRDLAVRNFTFADQNKVRTGKWSLYITAM